MKLGLVAEVKWEVREVCRRLRLRLLDAENQVWGADQDAHEIRLCLSGIVPDMAKERVERFLNSEKPDMMLCCGLAGALRPDIQVGDLVVQSADPSLEEQAGLALRARGIPYHVGPLVTVSAPVLAPAARRELAAKSGAIAVDMESQTIAALCRERGIPCMAMKGVSDGYEDDLTPILGGVDVIHIRRIALSVLGLPWTWPLAARLARHSFIAANRLGHGVWALLERLCGPAE